MVNKESEENLKKKKEKIRNNKRAQETRIYSEDNIMKRMCCVRPLCRRRPSLKRTKYFNHSRGDSRQICPTDRRRLLFVQETTSAGFPISFFSAADAAAVVNCCSWWMGSVWRAYITHWTNDVFMMAKKTKENTLRW